MREEDFTLSSYKRHDKLVYPPMKGKPIEWVIYTCRISREYSQLITNSLYQNVIDYSAL